MKKTRVKFKQRPATDFISVHMRDVSGKSHEVLLREARLNGEFDVPYHYLIHTDGTVENGRDEAVVGSSNFPSYDRAIFVVVDAIDSHATDIQNSALSTLVNSIRGRYPDIKGVLTIYDTEE